MAFHGCVLYLVDVSSIGKRFMVAFKEARQIVAIVATRTMAPLGLGRAQTALFLALMRLQPATQSTLAQAALLDPSATARSLTMMAQRGWVRRRRGEVDRREWYVELTPRGVQFSARVEELYAAALDILATQLDERDAADLERITEKLSVLKEPPAAAPLRKPRSAARRTPAPPRGSSRRVRAR